MIINTKTTKVMRLKQNKINIDENNLEQVKQYSYLGNIITGSHLPRGNQRIAISKNVFAKRKELLRGKMNVMLKKRIVKCFL